MLGCKGWKRGSPLVCYELFTLWDALSPVSRWQSLMHNVCDSVGDMGGKIRDIRRLATAPRTPAGSLLNRVAEGFLRKNKNNIEPWYRYVTRPDETISFWPQGRHLTTGRNSGNIAARNKHVISSNKTGRKDIQSVISMVEHGTGF